MAETYRHTRLQKLEGSDFEISQGQPDIRQWPVTDETGNKLGEIDELIFDIQSRKARYLVVNIEDGTDTSDVLVPIGIAEIHETDDTVVLPGITLEQLHALPAYDEDRFNTDDENSVRNVFGGLGASALAGGSENDQDFYDHDHFNEENLYKKRKK